MARSEARLLVDIWADPDFTARTSGAQQRFMFLLSQPDLAHTGVIPLRPGRWARKTAGATVATVRAELAELGGEHFIVIDEDTEEVLVRSFMRRDRVFKQPNVMRAAIDHVPLIESRTILDALAVEVDRIRAENPDLTEQQAVTLDEMANELAKRLKGTLTANPTGNPSEKDAPGTPGERGDVTVVSNGFPVPRSSDPEPLFPETTPLASLASSSAPEKLPKPNATKGTRLPEDFTVTDEMVAWARANAPAVNGRKATEMFCNYWWSKAGAGATKVKWELAWRNWMLKAQDDAERHGVNGRASPGPKPSTTDQRVNDALALGRQLQAQHDQQKAIAA